MAAPAEAPAAAHHQPSPARARGSSARCQICEVDLSTERIFFRRYRACPQHVHADQIELEGRPHRFCQQCGRFHRLECFDGDKRSCREQLAQHAARRRYLYRLRHGGGGSEGGGGAASGGHARSSGGKSSGGGPSASSGSEQGGQLDASAAAADTLLNYLPLPTAKCQRTAELAGPALAPQPQQAPEPPHLPLPLSPPPQQLQQMQQQLQQCAPEWQQQQMQQSVADWQQQQAPAPQQQHAPFAWQRTDSSKSAQQPPWQRTDSGKSAAQPPWQRTDSGKSAQGQPPWQRADSGLSGLSSTYRISGFLEAAAAAAMAAVAPELGTPRSAAGEPPPGHHACQSAQQHTPSPSPQPAAAAPPPQQGQQQEEEERLLEQQQQRLLAAELNRWVDEQLQQSPAEERRLLAPLDSLPLRGSPARRSHPTAGPRPAAGAARPARVRSAFSPPSAAAAAWLPPPRADVQELWGRLWQAVQPAGLGPPPLALPQLGGAAGQPRLVLRPVPRRVGVLAPSLSAAVAAGQLPLGVAAAQAQPLAALMRQMQRQTGPLQAHELLQVLERLQPPPALVAVPMAPPAPPAPPPPANSQLLSLLASAAPSLLF
ncbi:hypothetical protein CHLNCDRAFT_57007 [Chlorella variabilis]|uniref:SBP-type domain-containing protein n=1 Tax=Chlorella variabilis TaxID=554065 RepID=E1Z7A1_CHLVA|nr:hypothetical protein CHLNCDRAFT_57007 [Chlorella variabilis]EFN57881.1 hypothetical protein CHLNCDRAFT_57007 [Chlorella variabilis]|eukprot:XP_005849983.1 hypothetical protein CHLNCDRAFT_57007 [Chlorella variabilis]